MQVLSLPPSVTVGPNSVGVSVITEEGVTVVVSMPLSRGLHELPDREIQDRARRLAKQAMVHAAQRLVDD